MRFLLLIALGGLTHIPCWPQKLNNSDHEAVKQRIEWFFEALETQDSTLFQEILYPEGQVWAVIKDQGTIKYSTRYFKDDMKRFNPERVITETALDYDIKIHQNIAVAWVPYTLDINGEFSHCGVDVFTLIKVDQWKIINASFTIEPDGCKEVRELISK